MATLGQAYVQIMPSAKGISGSIQSIINPEANRAGQSAGKNLMASMAGAMNNLGGKMTKAITLPAMGAATAVGGLVSALGFKRLVGMDNAQAKLKGLGIEGKQLDIVMGNVKNAVTGTTHTMADGANVAAGALAAGVKEGADLERYIKLVGDAAIGANAPMGEMAQIFNRVQGTGKLMGTELDMIEHRMPGFSQALAKHLGVPPEEMRKMVSEGKVSSDDFLNVMDDFAGGMSEAYASTWSGLKDNVLANIGIIGEALMEGLFEDGKKGMAEFLDFLRNSDGLKEWATETGEKLRLVFQKIIEVIKNTINWWSGLSDGVKKFIGIAMGVMIAMGPILSILAKIITTVMQLTPLFKALGMVIGAITSPIGLVVAAIIGAAALVYIYWEPIKEFFISLWESIKEITISVWDALKEVWSIAVEFLKTAWEGVSEFFSVMWELIKEIFMLVWEPIQEAWQAVVEFFTEIWLDLVEFFTELWEDIKETMLLVWEPIKEAWFEIVEFFVELWNGVREVFSEIWNSIVEIITTAWNAIVEFITPVIQFISELISTAWQAIKTVISTVMSAIQSYIQTYWNVIKTVITTVMNVIKTIITTIWNVIKTIITTTMNIIKSIITTVWNVIKSVINIVLSAIRGDVSGVWNGIRSVITSVMNGIRSVISSVWNAIRSIISSVMNGIRSVITSVWNGIRSTITSVVNGIRNVISNIFNSLRGIVSGAMSGVSGAVKSGMSSALSAVTGVIRRFFNAGKNIATAIADGIKAAIGKVTGAIKNVTQKVRDFLPFSPPKTGPLIDIMDVKWGETISAGILKGEKTIKKSMEDVLEAPRYNLENVSNGLNDIVSFNPSGASKNDGTTTNNEYTININASVRNDDDIDRLVRKIDEKLQTLHKRRNASIGG